MSILHIVYWHDFWRQAAAGIYIAIYIYIYAELRDVRNIDLCVKLLGTF